jgi:hypothetical protein
MSDGYEQVEVVTAEQLGDWLRSNWDRSTGI